MCMLVKMMKTMDDLLQMYNIAILILFLVTLYIPYFGKILR